MGARLENRVALVSGAGSIGPGWGNGKAAAVLFAREGARVLAADIDIEAARETKRLIEAEGGVCEAASGNAAVAGDVAAITDACLSAFGRIDVLHNNVGIVEVGGPVETTEESWDRVNDVNLKSMFLLQDEAIILMPSMICLILRRTQRARLEGRNTGVQPIPFTNSKAGVLGRQPLRPCPRIPAFAGMTI